MKSYKQYCGVAKGLDAIGGRWTLLLVRDLLPGPRRFTDLQMPGLTPNMLSSRLKEMAAAGLIESVYLPAPAARKVWRLTPYGRSLEPVVLAIGAFGAQRMGPPADEAMSARWMMVSLARRYEGGMKAVVSLDIDNVPYTLVIDQELRARDGRHDGGDVLVTGSAASMAMALVRGRRTFDGLTFEGDERVFRRLLDTLGR